MTGHETTERGHLVTRAVRTVAGTGKRLLLLGAVVVALIAGVGSFGYFTSTGTGAGAATAGTLAAPVITGATPTGDTIALTWSPITAPGGGAVTYYVTRDGGPPGGDCPGSDSPTGVLVCTDTGLAAGSHSYSVTARWRSWSATSSPTTVVTSGAATKLAFTTSPQTVVAGGAASGTITVERQDAAGNATTVGGAITVDLSSDSTTDTFRNTADTATITSVTIASGASSADFKYEDTTPGSYTITASSSGLTPATQGIMVTTAGTKTATATGNWCTPGTWSPSGVPAASDNVTITGSAVTITIGSGCAAVANSVTLGNATTTTTTLAFTNATSTLDVGGNLTVIGPTGAATRDVQVNAGTLDVGGSLALGTGQTANTANRVTKVTVTTGTVTVNGNLTFNNVAGSGAAQTQIVMSGGAGTFNLAGAFTINNNSGTLTAGTTSSFNFSGGAAQTIPIGVSGVVYNNLTVDNAAGATLSAAITASNVKGNVTVSGGTLLNGGFAIAGNAAKTFQVAAGATFSLSGSSAFPTVFGTMSLAATSTVDYAGSGTQTIVARNYGHLTSSSTGARILASSGTIGVAGTLTPGTNAYTVTGSTVNFNGSLPQTIPLGSAASYNNLTVSNAAGATLGAAVTATNVAGTMNVSSGELDNGGFAIAGNAAKTFQVSAGASFTLSGTSSAFPTGFGTVTLAATSTVDYAGSDMQTIVARNYGHLTSSSTGARTLAGSGTIGVAGIFTPGTNAYTVTGSTVDFNGTSAQSVPIGVGSLIYNNLTTDNTAGATLSAAVTAANVVGNVTVGTGTLDNGGFAITGGAGTTLQVSAGATLELSGTSSAFPTGFGTVTLAATSTVDYAGSGTQTIVARNYGHLTSSSTGARILAGSGTIGVAGIFTPGTNAYTVTGSTVDFNGTGAQTIPVGAGASYDNLTVDNTAGATLGAAITTTNVTGNLTVNTGTLANGGFAIAGSAGDTFQVAAGAIFSLSGTSSFPTGFGTVTLASTSTVNYAGAGTQTVAAQSYGNLTTSSTGGRTLASSGTIAIAGTFTRGTNTYTVTGSTVDFNGTSAQTIPVGAAPTYNNVTVDNTAGATLGAAITATTMLGNLTVGTGTLANGGFAIAGGAGDTFQVAAGATFTLGGTTSAFPTGFTTVTLAATSTVNYAGTGSQTVAAQTYGNVAVSGGSTKTAAAGLTINGGLTIGSSTTFAASTFSHTIKGNFSNGGTFTTGAGSTVTFSGSAAQTIGGTVGTTFVNLTISNASGVSLSGIDATVSGTLALGTSILSTGANKVNVTSTTAPTRTTGYVAGALQRTGSVSTMAFPVGNGSNDTTVNVAVSACTACTITVRSNAGEHANVATSGIDSTKDVNTYWTLASTGTTTFGTTTFTYPAGNVDGSATPASFIVRRWNGAAWSAVTVTGTPTSTSTSVTGLSTGNLGDFVIGNP